MGGDGKSGSSPGCHGFGTPTPCASARSTARGRSTEPGALFQVTTIRFAGDDYWEMTPYDLTPPTGPSSPRRFLPLLLLLFVGSGCAAMIYEVVWLPLLQLVIGSTAASLGVLLGTFMGGMCLGSLLLPLMVCADDGTRCAGLRPARTRHRRPSGSAWCCSACRMSKRCICVTPATACLASMLRVVRWPESACLPPTLP